MVVSDGQSPGDYAEGDFIQRNLGTLPNLLASGENFLNFICVLHLRELMSSREHKTEAKQTCNKIILVGWVRSCLITQATPTSITGQWGPRCQGDLKVAGPAAVGLK